MKIEKGKKRGLKRLFVSILVMALLVTMLPHNAIEKLIVKAEEIVVPTDADKAMIVEAKSTTNSDNIIIPAYEVVNQALAEYVTSLETSPDKYVDGIVIKVSSDLDLSYVYVEGGILPQNMYFVFTGDYKLYGCERLCSLSEVMEDFNVYISGPGTIYTQSEETAGDEIAYWGFREGINVTVGSDVNIDTVCFEVVQGSGLNLFGVDKTIENAVDSEYNVIFYSKLVGLYKFDGRIWNIDEISSAMIKDGKFDVQAIQKFTGAWALDTFVYTQSALSCIPQGTKLTFDNKCYVSEYEVPTVPFIVDREYGLYTIEEKDNEVTMTVYSAYYDGKHISYQQIDRNSTEEQISMRIYMGNKYTYTKVIDGVETIVDCNKVIFKEGAIPKTYVSEIWTEDGTPKDQDFIVDHVIMALFSAPNTDFYFDMKSLADVTVFNHTNAAVYFTNENNNKLWVKFPDTLPQDEHVNPITMEINSDRINSYFYAEAGKTYTLKPDTNYSIVGLMMGDWWQDDNGYEYYRLADADHVKYYVDGSVDFTIPNFGCSIAYSAEEINSIGAEQVTIDATAVTTNDSVDWFNKSFTISMANHDICDVTENKTGEWSASIKEDTDGEYQKTYYVIDRTFEEDGVTPSDTYGKINKFEYSYLLDTTAPTLHFTDANNADSTALKSDTTYTGNLHLMFVDEVSGFGKITLDGNEDNLMETDEGYYISPLAEDQTYSFVIEDGIGNTTTYENIVVAAYEQNIEVTTSETECNYGEGLTITVEIKNTSENPLNVYNIAFREEETDRIFIQGVEQVEVIEGGNTHSITLEVPNTAEIGTYSAVLEFAYSIVEGGSPYEVSKEYSQAIQATVSRLQPTEEMYTVSEPTGPNGIYREDVVITAADGYSLCTTEDGTYEKTLTITETTENYTFYIKTETGAITEKAEIAKIEIIRLIDGTGSVTVEDFYYGEELVCDVKSDTNGTENVTLYYKVSGADDSTYTQTEPTAVGSYVVKAVFAETDVYKEVTVTDEFVISRMKATEEMYSVSESTGPNGIYREDVVITAADGYSLCTTEDGTYTETLTITETTENYIFYIKTSTGAITEKVELGKFEIVRLADGTGSVTVEDFYYGEELLCDVKSDTNGTENVTLYYKESGADDSTYTQTEPTAIGSYVVKAVFAETDVYKELTVTDEFVISRMKATEEMYLLPEPTGLNGVYREDVVITAADGYSLCTTENGSYVESLTITETAENYTFYIKTEKGVITEKVELGKIEIIRQTDGAGTVTVEDFYYGETLVSKVSSDKNGTENVTLYYKESGADDSTYTQTEPTAIGLYVVKAVFAETNNYKEVTATDEFVISRMKATEEMYVVPEPTETNGTYREDVVITAADGYSLCTTENGTYTESLTITETAENYIFYIKTSTGAITEKVELGKLEIIKQTDGTGSVSVEDFYYGEKLTCTILSDTNGTENVTLYYKESGAEDSTYSQTEPIAVGAYVVKAVFAETDSYKEVTVTDEFVISRMKVTEGMYLFSEAKEENGIYKEDVVITGTNGNLLCVTEDGTYTESLTITETTENYTFYIKTVTGAITEKVELGEIIIDKSVPELNIPVVIQIGRVRLELGKAYSFGSGKWKVKGDSTSYAPGITFYVPSEGDYEFSQE